MQAAVRAKQSKLINQSVFWNASLQKALFAKEVAQLAAVAGREFTAELLARVAASGMRADLGQSLARLVDAGLLRRAQRSAKTTPPT